MTRHSTFASGTSGGILGFCQILARHKFISPAINFKEIWAGKGG